MVVNDTTSIFNETGNRLDTVCELVRTLFPNRALGAVRYELLGQGLLAEGAVQVAFDYWETVRAVLSELQTLWAGPDVPVYILPLRCDVEKNGVSYERGICLFIQAHITPRELEALVTHEYCHSCHRSMLHNPPTLLDSLITEGLAEYAVESLYGREALNVWTMLYSDEEIVRYWAEFIVPKLTECGLHRHRALLVGGEDIPVMLGYCAGYRVVQAFLQRQGPHTMKQLLNICPAEIVRRAGFA